MLKKYQGMLMLFIPMIIAFAPWTINCQQPTPIPRCYVSEPYQVQGENDHQVCVYATTLLILCASYTAVHRI